ncbi:MAG: hypothetical protein KAR06_05515, partial [Deltaproteobacteria bacterium]|nr:hypothetical protein [Deltaproteobacteria bacterium]
IKQIIKSPSEVELSPLKIITLNFDEDIEDAVEVTFSVDEGGQLSLSYGKDNKTIDPEIRLQ